MTIYYSNVNPTNHHRLNPHATTANPMRTPYTFGEPMLTERTHAPLILYLHLYTMGNAGHDRGLH